MKDYAAVTSLWNYLERIDSISHNLANNQGQTPHLWYRGHACTEESDSRWKLIPSIQRVLDVRHAGAFEKERGMNNDFQSRASVFLETKPQMNDYSSWLTLMQHYGFPTRLLDWSRSPLYALYFATSNRNHDKKDGCIWILKPGLLNSHAHLETSTYIYHMEHNQVGNVVYSAFKSPGEKYVKYQDKIIACYATQRDSRVFNQQSAFTVHNSIRTLEVIHDEIIQKHQDELLLKLLIPAEAKKSIFDELFLSGITHSNVFPDVEHLALDIMKLYGI